MTWNFAILWHEESPAVKLLRFLRREAHISLRRLAVITVVSGLANGLVLVLINTSVKNATGDGQRLLYFLLFVLVTGIYIFAQRTLKVEAWTEVDEILQRIRVRIADKLRRCELEPLEIIDRTQVYTSLSRETQTITRSAVALVVTAQALVVIFFALFYVAWLSLAALVVLVAALAVAAVIQARRRARYEDRLRRSMERENELVEKLTHVFDGFVEIKMNPRRGDALYRHLRHISESSAALRIDAKMDFARITDLGQTMLYVLVATMIFVLPRLSDVYNDTIVQAATTVLFLTGPFSVLVFAMPDIANATTAIDKLDDLQAELDRAARRHGGPPDARIAKWSEIRLERVVFQFHHTKSVRPFTLGPVDLTLANGETLFIVGGNGSGKSTLLRLLVGLYAPDKGLIRLDRQAVGDRNLQAYRNLFSVIFSDFHLFDRLYGLGGVEEERVAALLTEMELARQVSYAAGAFSTLALSTGQRKRLAYVVSLLEDRPIYVFDEWAADQDHAFRKKFYEELLAELKARGKTVLAVTHDDRYWSVADRVLKMDEGKFVEL